MARLIFCLIFLVAFLSSSAPASDRTCENDKRVVDACYHVHGTLQIWANGRPRLNPSGTKRLLGIAEKFEPEDAGSYWPDVIDQLLSKDPGAVLIGDFLVCPFMRKKLHEMRLVCIESVSNLRKKEESLK